MGHLDHGAFSHSKHRLIYSVLQQCFRDRVQVSRDELLSRLPSDDQSLVTLIDLLATTPSLEGIEEAARTLKEIAAMHQLIAAAEAVAQSALVGQADIYELIDQLDVRLHVIADGLTGRGAGLGVVATENDELLPF